MPVDVDSFLLVGRKAVKTVGGRKVQGVIRMWTPTFGAGRQHGKRLSVGSVVLVFASKALVCMPACRASGLGPWQKLQGGLQGVAAPDGSHQRMQRVSCVAAGALLVGQLHCCSCLDCISLLGLVSRCLLLLRLP